MINVFMGGVLALCVTKVKKLLQIQHLSNKVPASMNAKEYPLSNFAPYREGRNPYRHKIFELSQQSTTMLGDQYTENHKGSWLRIAYSNPTALQFEIGSYHGETSIEMAKNDPQTLFLGMEWKHKQAFKAGKKAADLGLKNICFLRGNCARLPMVLAKGEVDRFLILFPDPWGRFSQNKWRLLNPDFIQMLSYLLKPNGQIFIKTDHEDYARYIEQSLEEEKSIHKMPQLHAEEFWEKVPHSPFERIFRRKNLPIYSFAYEKIDKAELPERIFHALEREKKILT
ncbi:MAG: hypothetical protein M9962_07065 [Oligoflexia bacterium]|nr:hypothetical protein [Oligoflexia bacterium]